LVRVIDADRNLKPGFTYEYQLQIRASNPNFGKKAEVAFPSLAEQKDLQPSPWAPETPISITLPKEVMIYGTELDKGTLYYKGRFDKNLLGDNDVAWMQIHRWVEYTSINPDQRGRLEPVADWCIGDVPVRRGEYIGRTEYAKVPMWFPHKKMFDVAVPVLPVTKTTIGPAKPPPVPKGIPVDFSTKELLVDWEGGKINASFREAEKKTKTVNEDANVEYLILSPDGKLYVHNSRVDKNDPDRDDRFKAWEQWVKDVEAGKTRPPDSKDKPKAKDLFDKSKK
jgi:hypothetical protein